MLTFAIINQSTILLTLPTHYTRILDSPDTSSKASSLSWLLSELSSDVSSSWRLLPDFSFTFNMASTILGMSNSVRLLWECWHLGLFGKGGRELDWGVWATSCWNTLSNSCNTCGWFLGVVTPLGCSWVFFLLRYCFSALPHDDLLACHQFVAFTATSLPRIFLSTWHVYF